jgi:hypothetical protein
MDQIDLIKPLFKLDTMLREFSRLRPVLEHIPGKDDLAAKAAFSARLGQEFKSVGVELEDDSIRMLTDGLCTLGTGAMALAIFAVTSIAEGAADLALSRAAVTSPDLDAEAVKARWQAIAEKSGVYASTPASDAGEPFSWLPTIAAFSTAEENLIETLFQGLRAGSEVTLTKDFADATAHGVEVRGLVLNTYTMATACNLMSLPFGRGVQAGGSFVIGNLVEQMIEKTAALRLLLPQFPKGNGKSASDSVRLRVKSGGFEFELKGREQFVSAQYPKLLGTLGEMSRAQILIRAERLAADIASAQHFVTNLHREMDQLKRAFDDPGEWSEHTSLRMQMAMDRRSKVLSSVSNLLTRISETAQSISQDLK